MAKKRAFASDSDVSRFISRKQTPDEAISTQERQQITIYPNKNVLEHVKILAKVKDLNLNSMFLALIREAMANEDYQKILHAYLQIREATL